MTNKVTRWYHRMKTWKVVTAILTPIATGEIIVAFSSVTIPTFVHVVIGVAALILLYIKIFVKDEDGDGIID